MLARELRCRPTGGCGAWPGGTVCASRGAHLLWRIEQREARRVQNALADGSYPARIEPSKHSKATGTVKAQQVERWFAELERRCLERGVLCSLDDLKAALEEWIKVWNDEAWPFKWTRTADQILDRICRYCDRFSEQVTSSTNSLDVASPCEWSDRAKYVATYGTTSNRAPRSPV
ncbi:hypothetical protein ACFWB2_33030 [Streptomyces virginiae]|uniref:hypothetical protein n=1 Tax=Streptomyces virginiae TaxID=1961 RepID=UPI003677B5CE